MLTLETTGKTGTSHWLKVRRTIDGKAFWCSTETTTPEQRAIALTWCKSLRRS